MGEPDHQEDWIVEAWAGAAIKGAWVVELENRVVAYLELESYDPASAFDAFAPVHPEERGGPVRPALLAFAERQARSLAAAPDVAFRVSGSLTDPTFAADCEAAGLVHVRTFWHMQRDLEPPVGAGPLPPGVTIRPSVEPDDDRAAYEVLDEAFRGHFGIEPMTFEAWIEVFKDGLYDPGLVLIAEAGGTPAGVAANWMPDGLGWVGDLGVREAFRGRGIGAALLRHSFALLAARGATTVRLNVDAGNESGATRLYASVGMTERRRFLVYEKRVRAAG